MLSPDDNCSLCTCNSFIPSIAFRYYHSEPKFVCEIENCGKTFYMRKLLKAHLNVSQVKFSTTSASTKWNLFSGPSRPKGLLLQLLWEKLLLRLTPQTTHNLRSHEAKNRLRSDFLLIKLCSKGNLPTPHSDAAQELGHWKSQRSARKDQKYEGWRVSLCKIKLRRLCLDE